jgi:hypothetical protein
MKSLYYIFAAVNVLSVEIRFDLSDLLTSNEVSAPRLLNSASLDNELAQETYGGASVLSDAAVADLSVYQETFDSAARDLGETLFGRAHLSYPIQFRKLNCCSPEIGTLTLPLSDFSETVNLTAVALTTSSPVYFSANFN